jgi:hypothetical protein
MLGALGTDAHMTYDLTMDVKATRAGQDSAINPGDALIDQEINSNWGPVAFSLVALGVSAAQAFGAARRMVHFNASVNEVVHTYQIPKEVAQQALRAANAERFTTSTLTPEVFTARYGAQNQ